jgi:DNA-sulfur modification-associated
MSDLAALGGGVSSYTGEYTFIRGEYALGSERVPYFSVAMTVSDAVAHLSLARDLIFDPDQPVRLEELFQRDLDKNRANTEIKAYLRQPHRIKFFNSFTVVLMPVERGDRPVPLAAYPMGDALAPAVSDDGSLSLTQVGTVRLRTPPANSAVGYISWNRDQIRAVIIDGQHRFFALSQLYKDEAYRGHLRPETTKIPVLVLVLDKRAGFDGPAGAPSNVLRTCRSIFIDLNKNAESVSTTRQYLMDDRDLTAVAMRSIITEQMGGPGEVSSADGSRIPLALVDWYSEQAKFDRGLHLTTIVVLYDIVASTIDRRPPEATDYEDWRAYIGELRDRVISEPWQEPWDIRPTFQRLDRASEDGAPFALMENEVELVAQRFAESLGQLVAQPLVRLAPYRALAAAYREAGLLGGPLELWLGHDESGKAAFERLTGNTPKRSAARIAADQKAAYPLAFQVVFQKAIVACAVSLDDARASLDGLWLLDGDTSRARYIEAWVERFDQRISPFLSDENFWRGTGIDLNGNINYAKPAVNGMAGLMCLLLLAPVDDLAADSTAIPQGEVEPSLMSFLERGEATEPGPLFSDNLATDAPPGLVVACMRWLLLQIASIRPGPPSSPLQAVTRTAAGAYRQQVRKYLEGEARALDLELPTELRESAVVMHGAKRLAAVVYGRPAGSTTE